jgi:hypothetical protein
MHADVLHHWILLHRHSTHWHLLTTHWHLLTTHWHLLTAHWHLLTAHWHLLPAHLLASHRHLLPRHLHELLLPLQRVTVGLVIKLVQYNVDVVLYNAVPLNKVLHLEQVKSHLTSLIQESLLSIDEVLRNHRLACSDSHRHLILYHLPLLLGSGVGRNVVLSKVV